MSDTITAQDRKLSQGSDQLPGERLRIAREKCGLSHEEVASHLKLSAEKIYLLEQGDVSELAAPVYVAGYLRAYAKLVGLPGDEIVDEFSTVSEMNTPSMDPSSSPAAKNYGDVSPGFLGNGPKEEQKQWSLLTVLFLIILVVVMVAYFVITDDKDKKSSIATFDKKQTLNFSGADVSQNEAQSLDNSGLSNSGDVEKITPIEMENAEKNDEGMNGEISLSSDNVKTQEVVSASSINQTSANKKIVKQGIVQGAENLEQDTDNLNHSVLVFDFKEDSWVEVNDASGKRLMYQLGKSGTSKTIWGIAPFRVQLGYVPGVDIRFNGDEYDLSGYRDRRRALLKIGSTSNNSATN